MITKISLGILFFILFIRLLCFYKPKFDLVESNKRYTLLLWFNKYDSYNKCNRVYVKLF